MNGNFTYHNPTRLHFGENAMEFLKDELAAFGPTVQLCYGGGSIKKNGIYDQVVAALKAAGKTVVEDGGVMPNPTLEKLMDGAAKAKANNVDLILAVGGRRPHPRRRRRIDYRLREGGERLGVVRRGPLAEVLHALRGAVLPHHPRRKRAHDGRHGKRDERRQRHHQPRGEPQGRQGVRPCRIP